MFEDREDAGELLAEALSNQNPDVDMVLLTSLESFPIGKKVASALDVPLNSMISRELTVPGKDLAFGAVSEQDTIWLDDAMKQEYMIGDRYISKIKNDRLEEMQATLDSVGLENQPDLSSKNVVLVSAGITSGMKEAASLGAALRKGSDNRVMVSTSVSETGLKRMGLADNVISLERSSFALSPNEFYLSQAKTNQDEIESYFKV